MQNVHNHELCHNLPDFSGVEYVEYLILQSLFSYYKQRNLYGMNCVHCLALHFSFITSHTINTFDSFLRRLTVTVYVWQWLEAQGKAVERGTWVLMLQTSCCSQIWSFPPLQYIQDSFDGNTRPPYLHRLHLKVKRTQCEIFHFFLAEQWTQMSNAASNVYSWDKNLGVFAEIFVVSHSCARWITQENFLKYAINAIFPKSFPFHYV